MLRKRIRRALRRQYKRRSPRPPSQPGLIRPPVLHGAINACRAPLPPALPAVIPFAGTPTKPPGDLATRYGHRRALWSRRSPPAPRQRDAAREQH